MPPTNPRSVALLSRNAACVGESGNRRVGLFAACNDELDNLRSLHLHLSLDLRAAQARVFVRGAVLGDCRGFAQVASVVLRPHGLFHDIVGCHAACLGYLSNRTALLSWTTRLASSAVSLAPAHV